MRLNNPDGPEEAGENLLALLAEAGEGVVDWEETEERVGLALETLTILLKELDREALGRAIWQQAIYNLMAGDILDLADNDEEPELTRAVGDYIQAVGRFLRQNNIPISCPRLRELV